MEEEHPEVLVVQPSEDTWSAMTTGEIIYATAATTTNTTTENYDNNNSNDQKWLNVLKK